MVWFRVDDKMPDHRKARRLRRTHPEKRRDASPFGIWALAGAWCGENSKGGFVPLEILEEWDDDAEALAERLVDAGLWWHDELDDEPGYRFHDWADMNPTGGEDPGDYGRRGNHIRWHERKGVVAPDCNLCTPDTSGRVAPDPRPESAPESSRPVPTRPVPTPIGRDSTAAEREFDDFWKAYPRKKSKAAGARAFKAARKKASQEAILEALAREKATTWVGREPQYVPHPATWLRAEPWEDGPDEVLVPTERRLPHASQLERAPSGMTDEESRAWMQRQRELRRQA